jgi:hypothetical protein
MLRGEPFLALQKCANAYMLEAMIHTQDGTGTRVSCLQVHMMFYLVNEK